METPETIRKTISLAKELNPTYAQFHLARAFFAHSDWSENGRVAEGWEVTSASVNGRAYVPHGFTASNLQRWLIRAYIEFYGRPSKVMELGTSMKTPGDWQRTLRGVYQLGGNILGLR